MRDLRIADLVVDGGVPRRWLRTRIVPPRTVRSALRAARAHHAQRHVALQRSLGLHGTWHHWRAAPLPNSVGRFQRRRTLALGGSRCQHRIRSGGGRQLRLLRVCVDPGGRPNREGDHPSREPWRRHVRVRCVGRPGRAVRGSLLLPMEFWRWAVRVRTCTDPHLRRPLDLPSASGRDDGHWMHRRGDRGHLRRRALLHPHGLHPGQRRTQRCP